MCNCVHDIKSKNCTLKFLHKRNLVEPNLEYAVCPFCGTTFVFEDVDENTRIDVTDSESVKEGQL